MKMQNSEIIQSFENICGGKGIRDGAVVRALGDICGLSLLLVPCSERVFSGYSSFHISSKTNISNFQFDLESVPS